MSFDLDALLEALRRRADAPLDRLEPRVRARIANRRRTAASVGAWGWRAALVTAAAAAGAFAGIVAAAPHESELAPFSIHAELAPSTLLRDGA
jgi:hypothetical protein